jgi:hypothetical protein
MSPKPTDRPSTFPRWVALSSLALVLWLFFSNTVPAVHERAELDALAADLGKLRLQYDAAIAETRLGCGQNSHYDLQALLVAIDQQGLTPAELCIAYPPRQPAAEEPPTDGQAPETQPAPVSEAR